MSQETSPTAHGALDKPPGSSPGTVLRLLPVGLCLAVVLMIHHPVIFSGFAQAQTDPGDTRLQNYFLEHAYKIVTLSPNHHSIWEMPFYYPHENVGAYSDITVALSPPYILFKIAGIAPDISFQLWIIVMTVLNFWIFYYFLRTSFSVMAWPAAFAAALFAAGAPRINQLSHQQVYSYFFVVLALIALSRLFAEATPISGLRPGQSWRKTTGWLVLFFAAGVAQCYAGFYNAFFLALFLTVALVIVPFLPTIRRRLMELLVERWPTVLILVAFSAALLLPMFLHYRQAAAECGTRPWAEVVTMLPRPKSWFFMGQDSWLYGGLARCRTFTKLPMSHEHKIGIGFVTLVVMGLGLLKHRRQAGVILLLAALVFGVLCTTFWFHRYSVWRIVFELYPAAKAVRSVTRVAVPLLIPVAVGMALFLQNGPPRRVWLRALLGLVCLLEQGLTTASFDRHEVQEEVSAIVAKINPPCKAFYITLRAGAFPVWQVNMDAMWAQMASGIPTVNGYSGQVPPGQERLFASVSSGEGDPIAIEAALCAWARGHGLRREDICWIKLEASDLSRYVCKVLSVEVPRTADAGSRCCAKVRMQNTGLAAWEASGRNSVRLGGRLFLTSSDGSMKTLKEYRTDLLSPVPVGGVLEAQLAIDFGGLQPGKYVLSVDMLQECKFWFADKGSAPALITIDVTGSTNAAPAGKQDR